MAKLKNIVLERLTTDNAKDDILGRNVLEVSKFDRNIGIITGFENDLVYVFFGDTNKSLLMPYSSVLLLSVF